MPTIKDSSSIEEVLQYIVACYGAEIYQEKQRLSNLIADLYTGEERLKRLYRRMVMEDAVSQQLYAISLKPIQEREGFYNRLVYQFKEANFYEEAFARQVLDAFLHGMNLLLVEPISTKATEEDGEWVDEFGVKYSADRKKLIRALGRLSGDYSVLDGTVVICDLAFYRCGNLQKITLPLGVTNIGNGAFNSCWNLQKITLPSSVTSIGNGAFYWCGNLREIILPSGLMSIGDHAFYWCNLQKIILPSSITNIGDEVFNGCENLQEITLPSSVTSIGDKAFRGCENLQKINVVESNKVYKAIDGVLYTKNLKTIICYPDEKEEEKFVIPSSVIRIGNKAFYECDNLREIILPSSITSIGDGAFEECVNLQEITLPSSVTSIGDRAFNSCWNLQKINVTKSNKVYKTIDGVLYTKDLKTIICYPQGKENVKFVIPSGVTSVGDGAFSDCGNLQEITLPSNITSIGANVFVGCENLQRINIPAGTLEKFKELLPEWTDKLHEI